jgi:hypothetical protein
MMGLFINMEREKVIVMITATVTATVIVMGITMGNKKRARR